MRDTIVLDRYPPDGLGITIEGGAEYSTDSLVRLDISASDPPPGTGIADVNPRIPG